MVDLKDNFRRFVSPQMPLVLGIELYRSSVFSNNQETKNKFKTSLADKVRGFSIATLGEFYFLSSYLIPLKVVTNLLNEQIEFQGINNSQALFMAGVGCAVTGAFMGARHIFYNYLKNSNNRDKGFGREDFDDDVEPKGPKGLLENRYTDYYWESRKRNSRDLVSIS